MASSFTALHTGSGTTTHQHDYLHSLAIDNPIEVEKDCREVGVQILISVFTQDSIHKSSFSDMPNELRLIIGIQSQDFG